MAHTNTANVLLSFAFPKFSVLNPPKVTAGFPHSRIAGNLSHSDKKLSS